MLSLFRGAYTKAVLLVLLCLLSISFVFWGVSSYQITSPTTHRIAGLAVSQQSVMRIAQNLHQTHPDWSSKTVQTQATNIAWMQARLQKTLEGQGFRTANQRITEVIESKKVFQKKGHFKPALFERSLHQMGWSMADYIEQQRWDLAVQDIKSIQNQASHWIEPLRKKQQLKTLTQPMLLALAHVSPKDFIASLPPLSTSELKNAYQAHRHAYQSPERLTLAYILIPNQQGTQAHFERQLETIKELAYTHPETLQPVATLIHQPIQHITIHAQGNRPGFWQSAPINQALTSDDVQRQGYNSPVLRLRPDQALVFRLVKRQGARPLTWPEAQQAVKSNLQKQKAFERFEAWLKVIETHHRLPPKTASTLTLSWEHHHSSLAEAGMHTQSAIRQAQSHHRAWTSVQKQADGSAIILTVKPAKATAHRNAIKPFERAVKQGVEQLWSLSLWQTLIQP